MGDEAASWVETVAETPLRRLPRGPQMGIRDSLPMPPANLNQPLWWEGGPGGPREGSSKKALARLSLAASAEAPLGGLGLVSMGAVGVIQWF